MTPYIFILAGALISVGVTMGLCIYLVELSEWTEP